MNDRFRDHTMIGDELVQDLEWSIKNYSTKVPDVHRIQWRLQEVEHPYSNRHILDVRSSLQKLSAKGKWSAGREIRDFDIVRGSVADLHPHDELIGSMIESQRDADYISGSIMLQTLKLLKDRPIVVWIREGYPAVEFVETQPTVMLVEEHGRYRVDLNIDGNAFNLARPGRHRPPAPGKPAHAGDGPGASGPALPPCNGRPASARPPRRAPHGCVQARQARWAMALATLDSGARGLQSRNSRPAAIAGYAPCGGVNSRPETSPLHRPLSWEFLRFGSGNVKIFTEGPVQLARVDLHQWNVHELRRGLRFNRATQSSNWSHRMTWKVGCWGRPTSNSAKIAAHIAQRAGLEGVDFHAQTKVPMPARLVIVTPNHGDAEVQEEVERFLLARGKEVRQWVVVEIGNYGGFDDWSFGARERIGIFLRQNGNSDEALPGVGIDTLPRIDWTTLDRWCDTVLKREAAHAV